MAHLYKDSGGGNTKKNPYTPGSWDWIQRQNKLAFQDRLKEQQKAKKESSPKPQGKQLQPQPGPPPNTPVPTPVPGPSPTPSPSPVPGLSPTPSPIPKPTDSGARNPVSNASETINDFREALKNGNIETMRTKAAEFFEEGPKRAACIHYDDRFDLVLMDNQFHLLVRGKGIVGSYDDLDDALKYVGWVDPNETDGNTPTPEPTSTASSFGYNQFLEDLAQRESSGDPTAVNQFGFAGLYQMGTPALVDADFMDNNGAWTDLAHQYGVYSEKDFLNTPQAQTEADKRYHKKLWSYIKDYHDKIGTEIYGVKVTASGLLAAAHLGGSGGVEQLFGGPKKREENSQGIPVDGNGTPLTEYMELFGGLDLTDLLGYNPDEG